MTTTAPPDTSAYERLRHIACLVGTQIPTDSPYRAQVDAAVDRLAQLVTDVVAHGRDVRPEPEVDQ